MSGSAPGLFICRGCKIHFMLRPACSLPAARLPPSHGLSTPRSGARVSPRRLGPATRRSGAYRDGTLTRWSCAACPQARSPSPLVVTAHHVSNVRKALLEREWIEKRDGGVVLVQPGALLGTWRENHRRPGGRSISRYTHLHGEQLDATLAGILNARTERPRAILALNSAAQWIAPFARDGTHAFYADEAGVEFLSETLGLRPAAMGANVFVHIPTDESLFDDAIETIPGVFCTNEIVTYLDLWCGNDREREAAEHLARESFPWLR